MNHKIYTIKELLEIVNDKNIDNFLVDFSAWLHMNIEMKKFADGMNLPGIEIRHTDYFHWIDDGKHGATITLKVEDETH